jgi:ComF family protein
MIHRFKYGGKTYLRRPLAILIAEKIFSETTDSTPDIIIPVPLHSKRLRQRGFNQAILIGELVSKKLQIPLARHLLKRIRWTEPQVTLSADKREANVRGAFSITPGADIKGKRVMLLDDVMTTGSTVSECSKVLKRAGAAGVVVVTAARVGHVDDDIRETVDKTL